MQILVVEDDADIRLTLEQNLIDAGYVVMVAETAAEAIRLAGVQRPDLVLLDLMLPDRPGSEVCRALRGNPDTREVPVIMVTARGGEEDRIDGFGHGADDYVAKPFSMQELLLRIEAMLRRRRPAPPASARIDSATAVIREQIRVWNGFSLNHLDRGEWSDCQEICRTILRRYSGSLTPPEVATLLDRIRRCTDKLGTYLP
jgi:two-component system phosphate regulon response regulator PhoB